MEILDLLFPKTCLGCGAGGGYICSQCKGRVQFAKTVCPVCLRFSFYGKTHEACISSTSLNGLAVLWNYDGVIRKSVINLKYKFAQSIAEELGQEASIEVKKFLFPTETILVPVPLYKTRNNWRGFNQAEEIGRVIAKELGWQMCSDLLVKNASTVPQVHLVKLERVKNIQGKFDVNQSALKKLDLRNTCQVVLFDDVWTTGATMKEACRTLKERLNVCVWGLTIARRA